MERIPAGTNTGCAGRHSREVPVRPHGTSCVQVEHPDHRLAAPLVHNTNIIMPSAFQHKDVSKYICICAVVIIAVRNKTKHCKQHRAESKQDKEAYTAQ